MDCFLGASTGTFKVVDLKLSKFRNVNAASLQELKPKEHGITSMCYLDQNEDDVLVAQRNGQINVFSALHDTYAPLFDAKTENCGEMKIVQMTKNNIVVTATDAGHVSLWSTDGECTSSKIRAGENLQCLQVDPLNLEVAATGGRENDLKLWDLEESKTVFSAKNVRDTAISLRSPIWVTNARFVNDSKQICTTTGHHQLRLYDPKAQRKPVMDFKWLDSPVTAISTCHRENHVLAGNTHGDLVLFDLRTKIRPIQKYKGFAGSIRSIHAHPALPIVATCGVDRFLMVHDIETRKVMNKIYCKTKLDAVLLRTAQQSAEKPKDEEQSTDDEDVEPDEVKEFFKD